MWTCPKCGETVDDGFDLCWNCGTAPDGTEDPSFVTADETEAIEDLAEDGDLKPLSELESEFGEPLPDLVDCYAADGVTEARFIADQLRLNGIPAVSDHHNMNTEALGGFMPQAWGYGPRIRVRPQDLTRARTWIEGYQQKRRERKDRDDD